MTPYSNTHHLSNQYSLEPLYPIEKKLSNGESILLTNPSMNRALVACMDMSAVLGGAASHYGGPAAFAEINSSIYGYAFHQANKKKQAWHELFHFVNDAGHCENGIYAIKACYGFAGLNIQSLKAFRSIESKLTGHGEAHIFPEAVLVSNGPLGSAVAQAQGLAIGDKLAKRDRICVLSLSDGGAMEGEAKEALSSIPGLAQKGLINPFICILSDNNTKLSGRIDKDSFSMSPYIESLAVQGWNLIHLENGNNLDEVLKCFEEAVDLAQKFPQKPVLIRAKTIKGIGTKATEASSSGGHGFPLKKSSELPEFLSEILNHQEIPKELQAWCSELIHQEDQKPKGSSSPSEKIQVGISNAMITAKERGLPILSISSDLPGSTGVADFRKKFPEASLDVGIAEANMVSVGAGLSLSGFIPVVDTFAQFGTTKGALPFIMSSLSHAPMIAIFSHIGFQDAADGASHQALSYFSILNSIPNLRTFALSCSQEADALLTQAFEEFHKARSEGRTPDSYVFFLGRENFPSQYNDEVLSLYKTQELYSASSTTNHDLCLIPVGSLVPEALKAAQELKNIGIHAKVIHSPAINKPNAEEIRTQIQSCSSRAIVIEEHQYLGGFHSVLAQISQSNSWPVSIHSLAVQSQFGQSSYTALELYQAHNLDSSAIVKKAKSLCQ